MKKQGSRDFLSDRAKYFQGKDAYLKEITENVSIPVLRRILPLMSI